MELPRDAPMGTVHLIRNGPVARLHLDNPAKLNALTPGMLSMLERHCAAIEMDAAVRAVIVSAEGDRAFCAGADIGAWAPMAPADFARHWVREGHRVLDRLARLARPTVAAVQGHALGGGLELAAACDLRVLSPRAILALPEPGVGIVPGWSGTQRLARLLPEPAVKALALFGQRLSADSAHALGFAVAVSETPLAKAEELAEAVLALSPRAVEVAKYQIHAAVGEDRGAMVEALGGGMIGASGDKAEGVAAFAEKRPPRFPGT